MRPFALTSVMGPKSLGTPFDRHYLTADQTSWTPMMKETYDAAFRNQLADDNITESFMRTDVDKERWEGKRRIAAVKLGRNYAAGSIGVKGRLPQAGRGLWKDFEITSRDTYTRVEFERYVMEQTRNKKGAMAEVTATEMDGSYEDLLFHRNRVMWGYGAGILALVNGAQVAATTIACDAPGNVAGSILGNRYIHGNAEGGMFVAFVNGAGTIQGSAYVTHVDADGIHFDVDTAITCDDNCRIVVAQSATQHSLDKEPEGLLAGIDDGTFVDNYHALSRTTYPSLKSTVITGVGAYSADAIQQGIDAQAIRRGGKGIDLFFNEFAVRRAYLATLELDRRYTGADLSSPDGGTKAVKNPNPKVGSRKAITFGDIPMYSDRDAPFKMQLGVNKQSWVRYVLAEGEWDATDGKELKWVAEYDMWTMFYHMLDNFHCHEPNLNIRWEGIDVDQILVHSN